MKSVDVMVGRMVERKEERRVVQMDGLMAVQMDDNWVALLADEMVVQWDVKLAASKAV